MKLQVKKLTKSAIIPTKAHRTDAGFDLYSDENVVIQPGEHKKIKTGIAIDIPEGHVGLLTGRSGITHKSRLRVCLGIIDAGYHNDVSIMIDNNDQSASTDEYYPSINLKNYELNYQSKYTNNHTYNIKQHDRIAQLIIVPISMFDELEVVEEFNQNQSERGMNGFGSTQI